MAKTMDDSLFEDTKYQEPQKMDDNLFEDTPVEEPEIGKVEALARGATQGVSLGFGEEIGAGVMSAVDAARRALGIKTEEEKVNEQLQAQGFKGVGPTMEQKDILSQYRQMRDVAREREKQVKEAQPETYFAGELVGGIAPAVATGGGTALGQAGLKGAAMASAKAGAKFGAATSAGTSEADLTKGEVGQFAKDVATGAGTGAAMGAAIPVVGAVGKKAKEGLQKVAQGLHDASGELGDLVIKAGQATRRGEEVVSRQALAKSTEDIKQSAQKLAETVDKVTRPKAQKLISEALDSEQKINLTDTVDANISKLDQALSELVPDSSEAKILGNIKAKFTKMKSDLLKEAGQDPTLPTKKEAYQKLLEKKQTLEAIQSVGAPQAQAVDQLFDAAAKIKGKWEPDQLTAERIQKQFGLPDTNSAVEMLRDVAKLKITKPKSVPKLDKSGKPILDSQGNPVFEIQQIPAELTRVIKKYKPEIIEKEGRLMLQTSPGKISPSDVLKFRADELTQPIELTPQQVLNLRDELRGLTFGQEGIAKKIGTEITEDITGKLKAGISPEAQGKFQKGMDIYKDIYDLEDLLGTQLKSGNRAEAEQTIQKLTRFIETQMPGIDPAQQKTILEGVKERVKRSVPELGEEFLTKTGKQAELKELQQAAYKTGSIRALGTIEAMGVRAGAAAGNILRRLEGAGEKLSGISMIDKVSKASSDQLKKAAQSYRSTGNESTANFLDELANVTSNQKKNALLFTASQNPNIKAELFGEEEK